MNISDVELRPEDERKEWVRPVISRLDAGSAENDVGANEDLSVMVS